jgi:hypothetical protein
VWLRIAERGRLAMVVQCPGHLVGALHPVRVSLHQECSTMLDK